MRRHDNRAESVHLIHTEIADRKRAAYDVFRPEQVAAFGALGESLALNCNSAELKAVGILYDAGYDAVVQGYGERDVYIFIRTNSSAGPTGIYSRMFQKNSGDERNEQVGVSNTDGIFFCPRTLWLFLGFGRAGLRRFREGRKNEGR